MMGMNHETVQEHVYNTTVPATCLPHTGFAGVWTPATYAELTNHRTIHKHGSTLDLQRAGIGARADGFLWFGRST